MVIWVWRAAVSGDRDTTRCGESVSLRMDEYDALVRTKLVMIVVVAGLE
jgi:hypothetical protein